MKFFKFLFLVFILAACQNNEQETALSAQQIAWAILNARGEEPAMRGVIGSDFRDYLINSYNINPQTVADGAVFFAGGVLAEEIAILKFTNAETTSAGIAALSSYAESRAALFAGYAPLQAAILDNAIVSSRGVYVALLITEDARAAERVFASAFGANPPLAPPFPLITSVETNETNEADESENDFINIILEPLEPVEELPKLIENANQEIQETQNIIEKPEETPNALLEEPKQEEQEEPEVIDFSEIYNAQSILNAHFTGDASGLTPFNRRIYDAALGVINQVVNPQANDFEIQLAIHDWIVNWAQYDPNELSANPNDIPNPHNDNPYGLFFSRVAICYGFSYTYELLMNMLGIQTITVHGTNRDREHAWNQSFIDGAWRIVDVTWNAPVGAPPHRYHFNLTSDFLWDAVGHRWDRNAIPEAY